MTNITANSDKTKKDKTRQEQLEVLAIIPHFGSYSITIGILLIMLGCIGILLPGFIALEATLIIASLLIVGSIFWLVHAYNYKSYGWAHWLKPLILLFTGGLMLFYPMNGVAIIGLLLVVYLILDALGSFTFAYMAHPVIGWGWMVFNGITSLALAILFLIGWPESTLVIVGLYISISLFFDGWALLYMGWMQSKLSTNKT
ncbi:MAG: DUF308 domain-containing protein [Cocleimonas sp.]